MINNFVFGYAHSGTRLPQMLLKNTGLRIGDQSNMGASHDVRQTLYDFQSIGHAGKYDNREKSLLKNIEIFKDGHDNWSLKECSIMLPGGIEFLVDHFDDFTCIMMIRDPRDNILIEIGYAEMFPNVVKDYGTDDFWERRMIHWLAVNKYGISYRKKLGDRFLLVNHEQLINNPITGAKKILDFLKIDANPEDLIGKFIKPESTGKYKREYIYDHPRIEGKHIYNPEDHLHKQLWKDTYVWYKSLKY